MLTNRTWATVRCFGGPGAPCLGSLADTTSAELLLYLKDPAETFEYYSIWTGIVDDQLWKPSVRGRHAWSVQLGPPPSPSF